VQKPYVLTTEINVHEPPERAALVSQPLAEPVVALVQAVQHLAHGGAFQLGFALPTGSGAQLGWDLDRDRHLFSSGWRAPQMQRGRRSRRLGSAREVLRIAGQTARFHEP